MSHIFYYVRRIVNDEKQYLDKHGRWVDHISCAEIMSRGDALQMADDYRSEGAQVGVL